MKIRPQTSSLPSLTQFFENGVFSQWLANLQFCKPPVFLKIGLQTSSLPRKTGGSTSSKKNYDTETTFYHCYNLGTLCGVCLSTVIRFMFFSGFRKLKKCLEFLWCIGTNAPNAIVSRGGHGKIPADSAGRSYRAGLQWKLNGFLPNKSVTSRQNEYR